MGRRRRVVPFVRHSNPSQSRDSARAWVRTAVVAGVAGLAAAAFAAPAQAAAPDTACARAGITTPLGAGLLPADHRAGDDSPFVHPRCE